ncbi:ESX secretion-associated protein EspG [Nocardia neocaledoniensis]|uniref:ESX secretion-associated protein EspG n=1 Tax=Nocardia neocaledoniensis TaxID=236511 RepID=UPI0032AF798F
MPSSRFTGQEFDILWSAYGRDRLPYPLRFRTDIEEFDALRRDRERAVVNLLDKRGARPTTSPRRRSRRCPNVDRARERHWRSPGHGSPRRTSTSSTARAR